MVINHLLNGMILQVGEEDIPAVFDSPSEETTLTAWQLLLLVAAVD